eukprot:g7889.t1
MAPAVARAFSESSLPSAPPPFETAANAGPLHAEDPGSFQPGQHQYGDDEKLEDVGELLRRQTQAREDWTQPVEMSEYERTALSKDLFRRIKGLAKAPKTTKVGIAIKILDEGRQRGVKSLTIYRAVLKQLLSTYGQGESASKQLEAILQRMREDGLEPDLNIYNQILDFHASVHEPEKAVEVYEEMLSRGLEPNRKTASHMIVAHSRGSHDAMYRAVEDMYAKGWQGSRAAYLSMIAVMGNRRDYDGVLYTFQRMREESKKPTEAAFVGAFRAAESLGQTETAKQVFEHRTEVGLPPQEHAYTKMMVLHLKDGEPEESLDYWRRLVCVHGLNGVSITPETYNLAIKCATRAGNLEEMEAVVEMMETQGIMPTEATYIAALAGFETPPGAGAPRMEDAERAFARIEKTGPPPGARLRQRQAVGYAHAGMWQKAVDLFQAALAEKSHLSPRDWKCVMMSQFEVGKYADVKATWILSTEGRNTSHSYRAFEYALRAAKLLEDADWAVQLQEAASKAGKGSVELDKMVVEVALKAGRLEEARAVLKEWEALPLQAPKLRVFQRAYEVALATCEKRGDAQLGLRFLDGMRSATPPYTPSASCPSFVFLLRALKDNGRAEEVEPFFDDVCASPEVAEGKVALGPECFEVLLEAEALIQKLGRAASAGRRSREDGIETGFGKHDAASAGKSQDGEGRETGETSSPKADAI